MTNTLNTSPSFRVKVRHDGAEFVGIQTCPSVNAGKERSKVIIPYEEEIEQAYRECILSGMSGVRKNIVPAVLKKMDYKISKEDAEFACIRLKKNAVNRLKTYRDKVNLNLELFNFFVTVTYSPHKFSSEVDFRYTLRRLWNNLAENWGWKVVGIFEKGDQGERLHFHAFVFIPKDGLRGEFVPQKFYSTKRRKWEYRCTNTYFTERFGINEFAPLSQALAKADCPVHYIAKYMEKSGERFFYSRGLKGNFEQEITDNDWFASYFKFVEHLVIEKDAIVVNIFEKIDNIEPFRLDVYFLVKQDPLWEKVLS